MSDEVKDLKELKEQKKKSILAEFFSEINKTEDTLKAANLASKYNKLIPEKAEAQKIASKIEVETKENPNVDSVKLTEDIKEQMKAEEQKKKQATKEENER